MIFDFAIVLVTIVILTLLTSDRKIILEDLAKKYTTPLYLVDEFSVREAIRDYQEYFRGQNFKSTIVYASKAFLVPKMAQIINEYNLYMDAVSMGDLYVALNANFPANHLVFHGNNKSKEELIFAIENKIGLIVVDNYYELKNLIQLCEERKIVQNILFRVNPGIDAHTHQYIQTAKFTSKFGESIYDEKTIDNIMKTITTTKSLNLLGFHAHIGSQIHEMEAFKMEIDKMIKDAELNAEADKKRKEEVDIRNNGDAMVFQVEKTMKDMEGKVDPAEVAEINKAKDELKAALEGNNTEEIKAKTDALQEVLYKMTEKMYAAAQAAQQGGEAGGYQAGPNEDGVYDAEYKEV